MLTAIGTWFAAKSIPWKWIGVGLVVLVVAGALFFGYRHVENLKNDLVEAKIELTTERHLKEQAQALAAQMRAEHNQQVARIQSLEQARSANEKQTSELRALIDEMTLELDMTNDPDKAVRDLNARHRELNRLLERASGAGADRR